MNQHSSRGRDQMRDRDAMGRSGTAKDGCDAEPDDERDEW